MSARHKRIVRDFKRHLPPEILESDVLDAGGLEIGTDVEEGLAFVCVRNVELDPLEEMTYKVRIRDKWDINESRIRDLDSMAAFVLKRVSSHRTYESVELALKRIIEELKVLAVMQGPHIVDDHYIAFYRAQVTSLDGIESRINRLISTLPLIDNASGAENKPDSANAGPSRTGLIIIVSSVGALGIMLALHRIGR